MNTRKLLNKVIYLLIVSIFISTNIAYSLGMTLRVPITTKYKQERINEATGEVLKNRAANDLLQGLISTGNLKRVKDMAMRLGVIVTNKGVYEPRFPNGSSYRNTGLIANFNGKLAALQGEDIRKIDQGTKGEDVERVLAELIKGGIESDDKSTERGAAGEKLASGETIADGTEKNEIVKVGIPGTSWVVKLNRGQGEKLTTVDFINRSANRSISTYTMYLPEQSLQDIAERISAYFSSNSISEKDFIKALNTMPGLSRSVSTFSNPSAIGTAL